MKALRYLLYTLLVISNSYLYAQVNLVVNGSANVTSINTGSQFTYTLNYAISSLTNNGNNVVATIPLPNNLEPWNTSSFNTSVTFSPAQISSVTYNAGTNTVTINFVNPIPAGSTGQLDLRLKYIGGTTPNGYAPNIITQISASNNANPNPTLSLPTNVTAIASNNFNVSKSRSAGGAINDLTIYQINISSNSSAGLNLQNPVMYDTLPVGVDFVEAESFNGSNPPVYNPVTRVVSWNWPTSLNAGYSSNARISVKYTSPTFNIGSNVTNSATLAGDIPTLPLGNFGYSQKTGSVSFLVQTPNNSAICNGAGISAATANWLNRHILAGTTCNTFNVGWSNNGNTELDSIKITYQIDKSINMNVIRINPVLDGFGRKVASNIKVEYATNINPFTTHTTLINDSGTHNFTITLPAGQYITQVRISVLNNIPIGATQNLNYCGDARTAEQGAKDGSPIVEGVTYNTNNIGDDGTVVTNTSSGQFFKNNVSTNFSSCTNTAEILDQIAVFNRPSKTRLNSSNSFNASDTVQYRIRVQIGGNLTANDVIFTDTLDSRLTYVPGSSLYYVGTNNSIPGSAVSITPTVSGNVLVWNLGNLSAGNSYNIVFSALINPGTPAGSIGNTASAFNSNSLFPVQRTSSNTSVTINTNVALRAFKGQTGCNPDYVYYPEFALAQEAGPVNYKITLKNLGNIAAKDIVLVDIFPFISDFRGSQWFANLVGPALTTDINSTVFYTTTNNPCLASDFTSITNQPSCNVPVWTTTPPLDITSVKALKITRNVPLPVFDSIELIWQMRAPVGTPNGLKMNNSVTFQSKRNDNNSTLLPATPNMVGMFTSCLPVLGSLGNYVWIDVNKNGIQDEAPSFGLNGVKVYLYNAGPNNIIGGGDDFIVDSTVSANDFFGNPGFYKFIELPTGNYYVKFENPLLDFKLSPVSNQSPQTDTNNDADSLTGYSGVVFIDASGNGVDKDNNTIDAGYYPIGSIGNYVWIDDNKDGINNEPAYNGVNGVKVYLYRDFGGPLVLIDSTVTADLNGNASLPGYYNFIITESGNYRVGFPTNNGTRILTTQTATAGVNNNSDANVTTGLSPVIVMNLLGTGVAKNNPTIDAGYKCNLTNPTVTGNNGFCTGGNTLLTGSSAFNYQWFRNGTPILNANNQTLLATLAGNYTLKITDESNCEATSSNFIVVVNPIPSATVNVPDPQQCLGSNIITFNVNSFSDDTRYFYNFGNGNIDSNTTSSMVYSYNGHGTFNYSVLAKDTITGCNATFNGSVTIWPDPNTNGILSSNTNDLQCLVGNRFVFNNASTISNGNITSYFWLFGDGNDSLVNTNDSMVYAYQSPGIYNIYLQATSDNNCTKIDTIVVEVKPNAIANFTFNDITCDVNKQANFNNTSNNATGYIWNFGDGNNATSVNPTHTYAANGTYQVSLIAYTPFGCNDTIVKPIGLSLIENAGFNFDILTCSNDVNFNNLTVGNNTYIWDFGDGNTSTNSHPTHTYSATGVYNVKLIATSQLGCIDTVIKPVNFNFIQPTALFSYNVVDCDGNLEFTNLSTNAVEYIWDFGNGLVCTFTINNIVRNFGPGTYDVKLIAKGLSANCADTFDLNIIVPPKPIAIFSSAPVRCTKSVKFNNFSYFASEYTWNFGDPASGAANTSSLFEPTHTFSANGSFIVRLIAANGGCRDTIYDTVIVDDSGILPNASFTYTDISGACINVIQFNNQSTNAVGYVWQFHDSTCVDIVNPIKSYPLAGNYSVTLYAISASGCVDSLTLNVNIAQSREGALAKFSVNDSVQCLNENRFHFYNNSVYYGNSWIPKYYWDFGDGTFDTTNTFIFNKKYDTAGVYTVRLVAVSVSGCRDTAYQTVRVKPSAKPNFFAGTICTMTAQITNSSNDDNIISFLWNYGENNNYVVNNNNFHTYTYSNTGWHIISLIAVAQNGCHDTVTVPVFPFNGDKPTADFEWDTLACSGAIKFKSTSWGATEFQWFFDDGTPVFYGYDPVHPYSVAGLYNVMLIASNGPGCIDTVYKQVAAPVGVDAIIPDADFKYEVVPCLNIVSLINNSYQATAYRWFLNDSLIATTTNATINNLAAGGHKLTLVALNGICSDTMHQYIVIQEKPTADFAYLSNSCSRTIVFNSVSQNAITYSWNFGDPMSGNNSAVGSTAAHTFMNNGTYFVKLVVENNSGCADSIIKPVAVNGNINPIRASFNYNYNTCDCPNSNKIEFDNTSQGNGLSYLWNFGDGRTSTQRSPNKGYADTGWFTVTLLAYDANGCAATTSAMVYIPPTAHGVSAGFTTDVQRQCITSNNFNFYNTSVYLGAGSWINKYYWYFGDGTTDFTNTSTFNKQYAAPGTYTVMLVAEALNGCRDTMTMNVVVEAVPCTGVVFANNNSPYTKINFGTNPALTETPVTTGAKEITNSQNGIVLYPNPTAGNFTIRYNKPLSGDITVKVYDMFGKTLYFQSEKQMGAENMQINSEGLADGKYFVVLYRNGEFVGKESVVIIH